MVEPEEFKFCGDIPVSDRVKETWCLAGQEIGSA